jgi:cell division protein ZapA
MDELIKITITIANRKYTLSVKKEDETMIKNATESINGQIKNLSTQYPGKDMQDIMAMVLINTSAAIAKKEALENQSSESDLLTRLSEINQLLVMAV